MASNKNQHFVPRCYLKAFTLDSEGLAINLFNIDRLKAIKGAPVKNQCSRDYFYGKDEKLEGAIQAMEGFYARGLIELQKPGYVLGDSMRKMLLRFWLFQQLRTEAATKRSLEMFDGMGEVIDDPESFPKMPSRDATMMAMYTFATNMDYVDDLKLCLVKNRTKLPFITSDDPAVMANRWHFEDPRVFGKSPGINSSGILAFLPLTPKLLCLAYDGDVYSVPHTDGWTEARRERDVEAINMHQFFNCRDNVYFGDWEDGEKVRRGFQSAVPHRIKERHRINYAVLDHTYEGGEMYRVVDRKQAGEHTKALIHTQVLFAKPPFWPSQIGMRRNGSVYTNGTGLGYIREAAIYRSRSGNFRRERNN